MEGMTNLANQVQCWMAIQAPSNCYFIFAACTYVWDNILLFSGNLQVGVQGVENKRQY